MFQKRFGRREFVRRAAVVGTGLVGLPHLIPSSALGDAGQLPPSQRIGIAFIGPGHRGTQLVREFAGRGDVEPLAVSDVRQSQRERVKSLIEELVVQRRKRGTFRGCRTYRDFRDVLQRDDIDGVILGAPEHWRATMCIMAAKAGKDVFTEKPFALTIKEGQAMVAAIPRA